MKIPSSEHVKNMLKTCCVHKLFWMSKQKTICDHSMFSTCSELGIFIYWTRNSMNNRSSVILWVSSKCQNKKQFVITTCSQHVLSLEFSFTELVIQWTIGRHIVGYLHCRKPSLCQNDPHIGESFWHSEGLLRCTMTLLQGPKDPVLPNLHVLKSVVKGQFWSNPNYLDQSKSWPKSILNLNQLNRKNPLKLYISSIAYYLSVCHSNWYKIHAFFTCLFRSEVARVDINWTLP